MALVRQFLTSFAMTESPSSPNSPSNSGFFENDDTQENNPFFVESNIKGNLDPDDPPRVCFASHISHPPLCAHPSHLFSVEDLHFFPMYIHLICSCFHQFNWCLVCWLFQDHVLEKETGGTVNLFGLPVFPPLQDAKFEVRSETAVYFCSLVLALRSSMSSVRSSKYFSAPHSYLASWFLGSPAN